MEQVGGTHYQDMGIQPLEILKANYSKEVYEGYLVGNILKYVMRYDRKNGLQDLKKASTYLNELIEFKGV